MTTSKKRVRKIGNGEVSAAEFKATCLSLMDEVAAHGRSFTITKRGRPVARLVPVGPKISPFIGSLRGSVVASERLTEPSGEEWGAERE